MFVARPHGISRPTTLNPAPDYTNTYNPAERREPPRSLADTCRAAHTEARNYFLWDDTVHIAVGHHRWIVTDLGANDITIT